MARLGKKPLPLDGEGLGWGDVSGGFVKSPPSPPPGLPHQGGGELVEVQTAVAAAEIKQRVETGVEARLHHLTDQDVMVAAVIDRVILAFEYAQRLLEDWRSRFAGRPRGASEPVLDPRREGDRGRLLLRLEDIDREVRGADERLRTGGPFIEAHQQQWRIERDRSEAVDGDPRGLAR